MSYWPPTILPAVTIEVAIIAPAAPRRAFEATPSCGQALTGEPPADMDRFADQQAITPETPTRNAAVALREGELARRLPSSVHRTLAALSSIYAALLRAWVVSGRINFRTPRASSAARARSR